MVLTAAAEVYGAAVRWRRRWYLSSASRQRRLSRPVVSVGNLRAGGSGKTPLVGLITRLLVDRGERPVVLSRGYGRRATAPGVTVVSDGSRVLVGLDLAGDEPLMLARALPGVPVLVGADRYRSGCLAEDRFAPTVHVLDDGFQHLQLKREVDLLAVAEDDLSDRLLPAGRLREPLGAAISADALVVTSSEPDATARVAQALGVGRAFALRRTLTRPRWVAPAGPLPTPEDGAVFVVSGIARPERFHDDLVRSGWHVAGTLAFRDHHPFSPSDVAQIAAAARRASAPVVLTTEKDGVRLEALPLDGLRVAVVPLVVAIEPPSFIDWLLDTLRERSPHRR